MRLPRRQAGWTASLLVLLGACSTAGAGAEPASHALQALAAPATRSGVQACPPGKVPSAGFRDVPASEVHRSDIDCAAWWEVVHGKTATSYQPAGVVSRDQLAAFVARLVRVSGGTLPTPPASTFHDVAGDRHQADIDALAAVGVVDGVRPGEYEPGAPVSRGQAAAVLLRAYEYRTGTTLSAAGEQFSDVGDSAYRGSIDRAAAAGFTGGYPDGTYRPDVLVARDQMATFAVRVLDLLVAEGHATVPARAAPEFAEEFSGTSWDPATWDTKYPWSDQANTKYNHEQQCYVPGALSVADGVLTVTARRQSTRCIGSGQQVTLPYSSGMIQSRPSFTFTYGYAEARVRLPGEHTTWPAFWLLPADYSWPPEVDVFEGWGQPDANGDLRRITQTYHWRTSSGGHGQTQTQLAGDFSTWHTYGVDWQPTAVRFYVDGVLTATYTHDVPTKPMYLLLNLAMQSSAASSGPAVARMQVDYVRVWRQRPAG